MEKVLLVEDERELQRAVKAIIELSGYEVVAASDGKEAFEIVTKQNFDVIVMDVMMPVMDGITSLKEMRKIGISTPIILLTAKSMVDDKVEGLDAGANDYITKPFDAKELLARIRALTRVKEEETKKFVIGNVSFNKENSEISTNVASLKLNQDESKIMEILVKNQERAVSCEEMTRRVWDENVPKDKLTMYVSFLKDKFDILSADIMIKDEDGYQIQRI
ncbi:MAG: response regulator transcription factor [Clostridia bacterium]|nr:response regulator transcription factor [Clostridia bacterium]